MAAFPGSPVSAGVHEEVPVIRTRGIGTLSSNYVTTCDGLACADVSLDATECEISTTEDILVSNQHI